MAVVNVNEKSARINTDFADRSVKSAMELIRGRVAKEKEQGDLNTEVYYAIPNPYEKGSEEYEYVRQLLTESSGKDSAYIDLFDKLRSQLKETLDCEGWHSFLMLNCRFDGQAEDNFLLYALVSWGG